MQAGNPKTYPVLTINGRRYVDMTDDKNPVMVWTPKTPDGYRQAPNIVGANKTPPNRDMPHDLLDIRQALHSRAGRLSSGDRHQILLRLEKTNPEIAKGIIKYPQEATATLTDYEHGKRVERNGRAYFDGLLIQHPETDGERLLTDEKGIIKAIDVWQMPLPLGTGLVNRLLQEIPELGKFFRTIFGTENLEELPDYAFLSQPNNPLGVSNLLCGDWFRPGREMAGRVYVDGHWDPSRSDERVASRAAAKGRIEYVFTHSVEDMINEKRPMKPIFLPQ